MSQEFPSEEFLSLPIGLQSEILSHQYIPHFKELVGDSLYNEYSLYFRKVALDYYQQLDPTITLATLDLRVRLLFDQYGYIFDPEDWYENYWNLVEIDQRLPILQSPEYQQALTQIRQTSYSILNLLWENLIYLPPIIGNLRQLQVLNLSENELASLPATIGQLAQLQKLYLSYNRLTTLPATIGQLSQLQALALDHNQLTRLPEMMGQLSQLEYLDLNHNRLTRLPTTMGQLRQLRSLDLSHNPLTSLPATMSQLTQLQRLFVDESQYHLVPNNLKSISII